jgi:hypothetical protein
LLLVLDLQLHRGGHNRNQPLGEAFGRNAALTAIEVRPSPLSGGRKIVEAIYGFTNRQTEVVEKFLTRVDVTEEFPFLVAKRSPYYDRST